MLFSFRVIASPLAMQMDLLDALLLGHYRYADGSLRLLFFFHNVPPYWNNALFLSNFCTCLFTPQKLI